jgi:hypothetical protein
LRTRLSSLFAFAFIAAVPACKSGAANSLIRTDPIAAGSQCPAGGVAVRTGVDRNGDGVLEDDEVASTSYVCNGGSGGATTTAPATLVRVVAEPAGSHCRDGGSAVEAGLDTNGNGTLDDAEVTTTSYVCNGDSGVLVRVAAEPAGAHCLRGGSAISSGADANHDGILEDNEITTTSYVCDPVPTTIAGDVTINAASDVTQLTGVPRIDGSLIIAAPDLTELVLPQLVTIGRDLQITKDAKALTIVRLAKLTTVGGSLALGDSGYGSSIAELTLPALRQASALIISGGTLGTVSLEALTSVAGRFVIQFTAMTTMPPFAGLNHTGSYEIVGNGGLTTIAMPANLRSVDGDVLFSFDEKATMITMSLVSVHGGVQVTGNDLLQTAQLAGANVNGLVDIEQNKALTMLDLPASASAIKISENAALVSLYFDMIADSVGDVTVSYNSALTTIGDFRGLRGIDHLTIQANPLLKSLSLPYLQALLEILAIDNPKLPACLAPKLDAQLLHPPIEEWSGDDTTATCN